MTTTLGEIVAYGAERLRRDDPLLHQILSREYRRQMDTLAMIAASSIADPSVLACQAHVISNTTVEGYPGARFHAGCEFVDDVERLAIERSKTVFGAQYANVQPHSGTSANQTVMFSLLQPGDCILGMDLNSGGHLTHGSKASLSGRVFNAVGYGVDLQNRIDYDQIQRLARQLKPKLIVCGASAYPRFIDFKRFREIADEVQAYLLADISHVAGLVAAGEHPSPIDHAHFTTTSTYKQLWGPRGGLILMGRDFDRLAPNGKMTLSALMQKAVFPMFQGTPSPNQIAAKARALAMVATDTFRQWARLVTDDARMLASELHKRGYAVLTGGSDNHIVLVDIFARGITGVIAEKSLEDCGIIINKNRIQNDTKPALVTSGMRLGTNIAALRRLGPKEMVECANIIDSVLSAVEPRGDKEYTVPAAVKRGARDRVEDLCRQFPLTFYSLDREHLSSLPTHSVPSRPELSGGLAR